MLKKKNNRKYMTTRATYKEVKKKDHAEFDAFCTNVYAEGFEEGRKSVPGVDIQDVMAAIKTVKGIGEKRLAQIEAAVSVLFENKSEAEV